MAITTRKITTYVKNIKDLSDTPNKDGMTADDLKAFFDGRGDAEIKTSINGIVDDLVAITDGASGADQIGSTALKAGGATTVQGQLEESKTDQTALITAHTTRLDNPHTVTKTQVGLSNVTNDAQATKTEYNGHVARTDNPHTVTASQVNAYSKTEMQTSGSSALHWGNLTNVPNMADASWKSSVATPADLPLSGNALGDQRVVLNDGDGKQAVYLCVAITGLLAAQWYKIADVDWVTDEATRVTQENARVTAEGDRVTAEGLRVTADSGRTSNEDDRESAESSRVSAESSRVTVENGRVSTEGLRTTAEGLRVTAEDNRVSAEGLRVTADGSRTTAEGLRAVAEVNRVNAESSRVTTNNAMIFIGAYDAGTAYVVGNQVTYLGSTYRNILNGTNKIPTDETYWVLIASKGVDGLGAGDMLKTTYDTTANGIVDNAELVNGLTVLKAVPAGALFTDTVYTHPTGDGNSHVPATSTTNEGKVLTAGATAGSLSWATPPVGVTVEDVLTSTSTANALSANQGKVLNELVSTNIALLAITRYVAKTGNDTTGNGTVGTPYLTIQKAIDSLPKNLNGYNATISIGAGTYNEAISIKDFKGGRVFIAKTNAGDTVNLDSITANGCWVQLLSAFVFNQALSNFAIKAFNMAMVYIPDGQTITGKAIGVDSEGGSTVIQVGTITMNNITSNMCQAIDLARLKIGTLAGTGNAYAFVAQTGGMIAFENNSATATTVYATTTGGRIYTGSQASAPSY